MFLAACTQTRINPNNRKKLNVRSSTDTWSVKMLPCSTTKSLYEHGPGKKRKSKLSAVGKEHPSFNFRELFQFSTEKTSRSSARSVRDLVHHRRGVITHVRKRARYIEEFLITGPSVRAAQFGVLVRSDRGDYRLTWRADRLEPVYISIIIIVSSPRVPARLFVFLNRDRETCSELRNKPHPRAPSVSVDRP